MKGEPSFAPRRTGLWLAGLGVVASIAAVLAVVTVSGRQRDARETAFANVSECLLGEVVRDPQEAGRRARWRASHEHWSRRHGEKNGPAWHQPCAEHTSALLEAPPPACLPCNETRSVRSHIKERAEPERGDAQPSRCRSDDVA